jgi:hypothetical protein
LAKTGAIASRFAESKPASGAGMAIGDAKAPKAMVRKRIVVRVDLNIFKVVEVLV